MRTHFVVLALALLIDCALGFTGAFQPHHMMRSKVARTAKSPTCSMDGVSRRDALVGLAGVVFGLVPLRAEAQFNVVKGTTKEKPSKKKGVRYNNLGQPIDPEKERPKPKAIDLAEECAKDPNFCQGKGPWCSCKNFAKTGAGSD